MNSKREKQLTFPIFLYQSNKDLKRQRLKWSKDASIPSNDLASHFFQIDHIAQGYKLPHVIAKIAFESASW